MWLASRPQSNTDSNPVPPRRKSHLNFKGGCGELPLESRNFRLVRLVLRLEAARLGPGLFLGHPRLLQHLCVVALTRGGPIAHALHELLPFFLRSLQLDAEGRGLLLKRRLQCLQLKQLAGECGERQGSCKRIRMQANRRSRRTSSAADCRARCASLVALSARRCCARACSLMA